MKKTYEKLTRLMGTTRLKTDEPLAPYTYFKIGGPADLFFIATSGDELTKAIKAAIKSQVPYVVLGGGSNVLVGDKGFRGLVIKNRADKIKVRKYRGKIQGKQLALTAVKVEAESGVITNHLVRYTIHEGLAGLEYFLGVPGTIGGAIYNNAHFKNQLIGERVSEVKLINKQGRERTRRGDQMKFAYDYSILQKTGEVVTSVIFQLKGGDSRALWKKAEAFAHLRVQTQPLNFPSSGCMFKNPAREDGYGRRLLAQSAGWLIDKTGLKGLAVGGAMVSPKHANFIINTGQATAGDVLGLVAKVRTAVNKKFGVALKFEVFQLGEF
ncbi:MAG: UDP-N-acetylenolpyruvoylglucosamine reductase [Candidatus Chisholmbacteria bacterium RIFCSPHIGHO2_12_FULL_49_9]|uniref:UDP-N-acetylenolpyruvoylglucosamine reductase n=1 Tax=Candidatus Chisholmbacteria bacterium RIFCSPHIGHO2_01_FULL_52_32 TaxID=1797591 RepID=A0A1G1VU47_9BACT|nr:MAG: UDP-N-acetylenolpyruvoylglucosamine reductase [Candidatus Chisholmbacteria bacterium RIFCSPHIGHO2_01_FULL_52_32]OGY20631.1 MAG: UDP-N-acetylenolpyruvoylglucosamine reductase [Candidatus Chisholmbacteria bacterium RIFCSPLOWO2_01_FULL_50_28]OGY21598.1 MAG: UDP-N-acetylenolpyruvoylglucosamine reductase [Candidatus Chisholmbacteria bacterium RIFCSPHIGHO2_12_FULL_49_9]